MLIPELIERKRNGAELSPQELHGLLEAFQSGQLADYQMSAFLMAVYFQGLSRAELDTMTRAMIGSGTRLSFQDDGRPPAVDKHSTGGVGDKVSLVLAPLLAEYGLRVPMMSGRGLGHTGGTVDKLESIPGFRTGLDLDEFRSVLDEVGCAMIRQTPEIAPLDGRLYALRDVTATVESVPLIAASIISKKVAEGIEALVLDVKFGRGAFMTEPESALELARTLVELAGSEGLHATALLTAMDEPLGVKVGNALEVREALECLEGGGPADLREVTLELCADVAVAAGVATRGEAWESMAGILDDGGARERFGRLVVAQGGDQGTLDDPDGLPSAPERLTYESPVDGMVAAADARRIGLAALVLGAGRRHVEDDVDPAVGLEVLCRVGDVVERGQPLVMIHARSEEDAAAATSRVETAIEILDEPPEEPAPLVWKRVTEDGVTDWTPDDA
jgi:pyrimidine-nucleoside phosphorylase